MTWKHLFVVNIVACTITPIQMKDKALLKVYHLFILYEEALLDLINF
jgi:hypothetical protein